MTRVFITGANGFIGRTLLRHWQQAGHEVSGLDITADPTRGVVAGDVTARGDWQSVAAEADVVIHTAALVSNTPTLDAAWRVNVLGTRTVLDAAAAGRCSRFVHLSSIRVFSDLDFPDGVTEHHPVRPDGNPYVVTRVASEQVVLQAHAAGEIPVTIIRPGDVYGPASRPWTVLPVEMIKAGRFLLPAGGKGIFSPVFVDDLVVGITQAATADAAAGRVLTLAGTEGVTCSEFFGHYFRMLGKRGPIALPTPVAVALSRFAQLEAALRRVPTEATPVTMRYLARTGGYSIALASELIGYAPSTGLDEGMALTEEWLRSQGHL